MSINLHYIYSIYIHRHKIYFVWNVFIFIFLFLNISLKFFFYIYSHWPSIGSPKYIGICIGLKKMYPNTFNLFLLKKIQPKYNFFFHLQKKIKIKIFVFEF